MRRETDRKTDRKTLKQIHTGGGGGGGETDRKTDRKTDTKTQREGGGGRETERQKERLTLRQRGEGGGEETEKQTERLTLRHTHTERSNWCEPPAGTASLQWVRAGLSRDVKGDVSCSDRQSSRAFISGLLSLTRCKGTRGRQLLTECKRETLLHCSHLIYVSVV